MFVSFFGAVYRTIVLYYYKTPRNSISKIPTFILMLPDLPVGLRLLREAPVRPTLSGDRC